MNTDKSGRFVRTVVLGVVLIVFLALGGGMWAILNRGEALGLTQVIKQPEVHGTDRATVDQLLQVPLDLSVRRVEYEYIEAADVPPAERQYLVRGRRAMVVALSIDPDASPALESMMKPLMTSDAEFARTMPCLRAPCLPERYFDRRGARLSRQPMVWELDPSWFGMTAWPSQEQGWAVYDANEEAIFIYRIVPP